ncbi:hypothetical protein TEA_000405 [Camellia sinensis var. sinensis]|uniref:Non-haem dioxygenase N-terminal domain-containing protein n=1 Tax=Camellia sinensis var. sinensis TaxID=542762 RepID=A0A4S4E737_CAMSN|nr:hypothetical protein TEA_000405 [Camellia sinensis var. sinensis]
MASSTHHLPNPYGTTAAPPPTPSTQPNPLPSSAPSADVLSRLLHRLPPTLSLPTRLSPPPTTITTTTSPPLISLSPQNPTLLTDLLSASCQFGFFHLTNHSISPQLARSAESDSLSLFTLSNDQKQIHFPKNWPLGFDCDDNEDDDGTSSDSFCFDSACSPESTELSLSSLREFTREMEKVGLEVVEALSCAVGFENPVREDPTRVCSLMWISEGSPGNTTVRFYPYVVGLEYQIRCRKYSLLADSGWVSDSPRVDSILVTLGDIAQVVPMVYNHAHQLEWFAWCVTMLTMRGETHAGQERKIKRLMKSQEIYEKQGRPFALSSETSHNRQRYAAKGDDVEKLRMFATPRMDAYLEQAKSFDEDPSKTLPSGELTFSEVEKRFGVVDGDGEAAGLRWHHSLATEAAAEDRNWEVWSNGKMKKVRGRPVPSFEDGSNNNNAHCISMSLLVTLPLESMVSPLLPKLTVYNGEEDNQLNKEDDDDNGDTSADTREDGAFKFNSFSFEDYAWRIYHERLLLKDPLARYRI